MERLAGAERRDRYVQALGGNAAHTLGKEAEVGSADGDFFEGDERRGLGRVVVEHNSLENASREGKVGSLEGADLQLAIAGFAEILDDGGLGEGPEAATKQHDCEHWN